MSSVNSWSRRRERLVPSVPSSASIFPSHHSNDHPSIPNTIIETLDTAQRVMELAQIDHEVRKFTKTSTRMRCPMRCLGWRRISVFRKWGNGKYAALGVHPVTGRTRGRVGISAPGHDSTPIIAQRILQKRVNHTPWMRYWLLAKAEKPDLKRHSLVSSVYGNAKINRFFKLVAPKTFGLLEWENHKVVNQNVSTDTNISEVTEGIGLEETQPRENVEEGIQLVHRNESMGGGRS